MDFAVILVRPASGNHINYRPRRMPEGGVVGCGLALKLTDRRLRRRKGHTRDVAFRKGVGNTVNEELICVCSVSVGDYLRKAVVEGCLLDSQRRNAHASRRSLSKLGRVARLNGEVYQPTAFID